MSELKNQITSFDGRAPRYTSYPTAPHFKSLDSIDSFHYTLSTLGHNNRISLYFHVPFCQKMCWYCGCNTKISQRYAPIEDYVHLMLREIDILSGKISGECEITNIHFGGGSPGILRSCDFALIMSKVREKFQISKDAEIALELDPRGITESRIACYAKHGVNRVSLGIQDFNDKVLKSVNREQPFQISYDAAKLLRSYGINNINTDIMYGLPHQNTETIKETLTMLGTIAPDRIAFFGYAHVPWMKKHMRLIDETILPNTDMRYDLYESGLEILLEQGYLPIGIDHFAKPEDSMVKALNDKTLRRNFQGYTTDSSDNLIGIGASSIGKINNTFFQNAPATPIYKTAILAGELSVTKTCTMTHEDIIRADIIEQLMCYLSVDMQHICEKYNLDKNYFANEMYQLDTYKKLGLVTVFDDQKINIQAQARLMARIIASTFDQYIPKITDKEQPAHAKAI